MKCGAPAAQATGAPERDQLSNGAFDGLAVLDGASALAFARVLPGAASVASLTATLALAGVLARAVMGFALFLGEEARGGRGALGRGGRVGLGGNARDEEAGDGGAGEEALLLVVCFFMLWVCLLVLVSWFLRGVGRRPSRTCARAKLFQAFCGRCRGVRCRGAEDFSEEGVEGEEAGAEDEDNEEGGEEAVRNSVAPRNLSGSLKMAWSASLSAVR